MNLKPIIAGLGAAALLLTLPACEPEETYYTFEEISFHYSPEEFTIVSETPISNGVHLVVKGEGTQKMDIDIINRGDGFEDLPWDERQAVAKADADRMFQELVNDPSYNLTCEPINANCKLDRWSTSDVKPFSTWDVQFSERNGEPVSSLVHVEILRNYELRFLAEASNSDQRGNIYWLSVTFGFDDE